MNIKTQRIKIVAKDGTLHSLPLGEVEITVDDKEMKFINIVEEVLQLREDLTEKEITLKASQAELDKRIESLKSVDLQEMRVVVVSVAERLKKLEDETDII